MTTREIHLAARPIELPTLRDFELVTMPMPSPADGELLVRNIYMSVDPYMRGRMGKQQSYAAPFDLGKPLDGEAVGQVIVSRTAELVEGDFVFHQMGWREYFVSAPGALVKVDAHTAPLSAFLGILGMPGFTAWYGLTEIGKPERHMTVFVSAAAGAVGSVVGQLAKAKGCRVIGSVGSDEKVSHVCDDLGFDGAFNYRSTPPSVGLRDAAPDGIDIYFDNVGGSHLEAALRHLRDFGRVVACGMISQYNKAVPDPGPNNLVYIVTKRLLVRGFIIRDHWDRLGEFQAEVAPLIARGAFTWRETITEGIENAPSAFLRLFSGDHVGKMLVQVGDDPTGSTE